MKIRDKRVIFTLYLDGGYTGQTVKISPISEALNESLIVHHELDYSIFDEYPIVVNEVQWFFNKRNDGIVKKVAQVAKVTLSTLSVASIPASASIAIFLLKII